MNKSLFLINILFGKIVYGRILSSDLNYKENIATMKIELKFWPLDSVGIKDTRNDNSKLKGKFIMYGMLLLRTGCTKQNFRAMKSQRIWMIVL